ncbi:MAG: DsbA family protein [Kofleriaceae bacterium]
MIIAKRLKGKAIATLLGPTGEAARRALTRVKDSITNAPRRLDFYFEVGDAVSYLTAQAVARLVEQYPVELAIHIITPPASDVDAAPTLRPSHTCRDAQQLAAYYDLEFPGKKEADPGAVREVSTALIRERTAMERLQAILELGKALWQNDRKLIATLLGKFGAEAHNSVPPYLNAAYAELRRKGHYQGAMLHYNGIWYWGIDRLPYLEAELARDLDKPLVHVVQQRPLAERGPLKLSDKPLTCEMWFSFRSPYSYLALEQIETILAPYDIPLVLKPVAPMVARGMTVPAIKRMYIVRDAKREADRLGIAFGELCDPLGAGIDNCLAIAHWAGQRGAALAFAKSAMRGIWSEARDVAEYVDLREIVERAGLPWNEAKEALGKPEALKAATVNAQDLAVVGLWGVPSFRVGDFTAWGQDRLPQLVDRLRRHALAGSS